MLATSLYFSCEAMKKESGSAVRLGGILLRKKLLPLCLIQRLYPYAKNIFLVLYSPMPDFYRHCLACHCLCKPQ